MKKITTLILSITALLVLTNLVSCKKLSSYDYPPTTGSAYDIIQGDLNFSYFKTIVDKAGLADLLKGNDQYTVFTPNNAAFIASGYTLVMLQAMSAADLAPLVKNHIVAGKIDVKTATGTQTTLSNTKITLQAIAGSYYADGGDILNPNEDATNGSVNVISKVLVTKPTLIDAINGYTNATANSQLTFLAAAIIRASTGSTNFTALLSGTDPYTLFAPTNGAFIDGGYATIAAINAAAPDVLGNILKYHLIAGSKFTTAFDSIPLKAYNGTNIYFDVTKTGRNTTWFANGIIFGAAGANVVANNGVFHTVPRLLPTPVAITTLDRIQSDATLTMFYALVLRASTSTVAPVTNFQTLLSGNTGSYTVFAINNAGLIAAGYANVAAINAESPDVLAQILKLHILPKRVNNINIAENGTVNSLLKTANSSGSLVAAPLTFTLTGGYKIKGASNVASIPVITANVTTTNGILNIIGSVLTP